MPPIFDSRALGPQSGRDAPGAPVVVQREEVDAGVVVVVLAVAVEVVEAQHRDPLAVGAPRRPGVAVQSLGRGGEQGDRVAVRRHAHPGCRPSGRTAARRRAEVAEHLAVTGERRRGWLPVLGPGTGPRSSPKLSGSVDSWCRDHRRRPRRPPPGRRPHRRPASRCCWRTRCRPRGRRTRRRQPAGPTTATAASVHPRGPLPPLRP